MNLEDRMVDATQSEDFERPIVEAPPQASRAERRRRWPWVALALLALLAFVCMCALVAVAVIDPYAEAVLEGVRGKAAWEATADQFMQAMRDGEIERAYSMAGREAEEAVVLRDLQEMTTGSKVVLFQGYRALSLESWEITKNLDGTFATTEGSTTYADGYTGNWTFTFVLEDGEWRVYSFYVWVPWEKIDAFHQP